VIETLETATNISLSKGSRKRGKNPFKVVDRDVDIEDSPDYKISNIKGKNLIFHPQEVKVTKPRETIHQVCNKETQSYR
jgi:hypothetical protein